MKKPCVANLDTARELVEHGIVGEGARALVDLRRCAADCGCDDWQNCDHTVQDAWQEATTSRRRRRPGPSPCPRRSPGPRGVSGTEPAPPPPRRRLALMPELG